MRKFLAPILLWTVYVPLAHAQDLGKGMLDTVGKQAGLTTGEPTPLPTIIGNFIKILLSALGIIFVVLTIYAGFLYLTARGDESHVEKAKGTLQTGVIGMAIILSAYAITSFVVNYLTVAAK